jgi:hypothetical protein
VRFARRSLHASSARRPSRLLAITARIVSSSARQLVSAVRAAITARVVSSSQLAAVRAAITARVVSSSQLAAVRAAIIARIASSSQLAVVPAAITASVASSSQLAVVPRGDHCTHHQRVGSSRGDHCAHRQLVAARLTPTLSSSSSGIETRAAHPAALDGAGERVG